MTINHIPKKRIGISEQSHQRLGLCPGYSEHTLEFTISKFWMRAPTVVLIDTSSSSFPVPANISPLCYRMLPFATASLLCASKTLLAMSSESACNHRRSSSCSIHASDKRSAATNPAAIYFVRTSPVNKASSKITVTTTHVNQLMKTKERQKEYDGQCQNSAASAHRLLAGRRTCVICEYLPYTR